MMRAHRKNGRPSAEAFGTPVAINAGPSRTDDTPNLHLTLVRVQPSATATRGRNLVRFLTDLAPEKPVPVVAECPHCHHLWDVAVDLTDEDAPVVLRLRDNCLCGESLDTPTMIRLCIGVARNLVEAVWIARSPA